MRAGIPEPIVGPAMGAIDACTSTGDSLYTLSRLSEPARRTLSRFASESRREMLSVCCAAAALGKIEATLIVASAMMAQLECEKVTGAKIRMRGRTGFNAPGVRSRSRSESWTRNERCHRA